jgi:ATP-binding cassette subfamily B protein
VGIGLFALEVIACVLLVWGSRKMGVVFTEVRKVTGLLSRVVADVTKGLRELAFTPHAQYASRRGDAVFDDFLKKQLKSNVWDAGYYSAAESLYPILLAAVLVFFPEGEMGRMALLAVLIDLIQKSISPIKEVAGKISSIQRARTGLDRIMEFHQHFAGTQELRRSLLEMNSSLEVKVEHFSYQWTDESAFELNDISFKAQAGELVGIVGMSGCGKSTLLRLLSGQHGSFKGSVLVDGTHTLEAQDEQDLGQLCQLVSLVSQDSHVFSSSVEFNIALDLNASGFQEFWQNAQKALPYLGRWGINPDTPVDVKSLSLGQKQLLSGLRACFLRKPIVLFDEVSSGLDPDLEKALRDLVLIVQRHSLTIIVTHRLETILSATKLLVMKEGRLMDTGSPRELMQSSEIFREFIEHLKN